MILLALNIRKASNFIFRGALMVTSSCPRGAKKEYILGTGMGGESAFGSAFSDQFKPNLTHTGRGGYFKNRIE